MKLFSFNNKKIKPWQKYYNKNERVVDTPDMSLYEYLYESNQDRLSNTAISYFGNKMSYDDFFMQIDICAKALKCQGVRKDDVISICMPNTPETVIMFYAVSKIGAISNMIHPLSAEEEIKKSIVDTNSVMLLTVNFNYKKIANIIEDTSLYKVILSSPRDSMPKLIGIGYFLLEDRKVKLPKNDERFILWDNFFSKGKNYDASAFARGKKDNPAVILHSGGTSGTPKSIILSNGNINVVPKQARIALPDITERDSMLGILPMFHCFGLVECVHYPLSTGIELILVPRFDAARFDKLLRKYRPTLIAGVPTLFEALLKNKHTEDLDLSNVKYVVSGGDSLNEERNKRVNDFLNSHGCVKGIVQGYGMTETSGGCIFSTSNSYTLGSVGIPLPSNDLRIIDPDTHKEIKTGQVGEIQISGPSVMLGYLNNQEETDKVLEKDVDGKIWVHTGDLGYINKNGCLFFVQRLKRLIISSGYNVYPSHIEEILNKSKYVLNSCVVGVPHPYKVQVPKAYIVLKSEYHDNQKIRYEIKEYLEKNLAKYMIPKEYVFRETLPKTMIGKVDYKKLENECIQENSA